MKRAIPKLIETLYQHEEWAKARALILRELKKNPKDHWYLTRLSGTYYEQRKYQKALEVSDKAVKLAPNCPLALRDRAGILEMLGCYLQAMAVWSRLLKRGVNSVAYGPCGEGMRWARSLLNDCRYSIGNSYRKREKARQAHAYFRAYMKFRSSGVPSIYSLRDVKKQFSELLMRETRSKSVN